MVLKNLQNSMFHYHLALWELSYHNIIKSTIFRLRLLCFCEKTIAFLRSIKNSWVALLSLPHHSQICTPEVTLETSNEHWLMLMHWILRIYVSEPATAAFPVSRVPISFVLFVTYYHILYRNSCTYSTHYTLITMGNGYYRTIYYLLHICVYIFSYACLN